MPGGNKDVMFVLGANDTLYAIDATTGAQLWQKNYPNPHKPTKPATWLCPNTPNATPTIDKARGIVFFMASDGLLRGVCHGRRHRETEAGGVHRALRPRPGAST